MKILLWSDVHCHIHKPFSRYEKGMNSRLLDGLRVIDQVTEVAADCDQTVFLGDLFHVAPPPAPAFNEVYDRIRKLGRVCSTFMLAGNHDLRGKYYDGDHRDIPFLKMRRFDGINIAEVDASMTVEMQEGEETVSAFAFNHRREADAVELIKGAEPHDLLLMHQEVFGADNEFNYTFKNGMHPDDLKKFKWVFTGHIHKPQILNERVVVVGAPLHINFGDVGDRGFFVLDTEKDDVEVHETTFPRFVTLGAGEEAPDDDNFYRPQQAKEKKTEALKIPGQDEAIESYCEQQKHMEYVEAGRKIAESVSKEVIAPQPFVVKSIALENFGVFESVEYDVESGMHMVLGEIVGSDGRSNGAGKTTLFEGMSWAIYGRTSKGTRGSSVMRRNRKRGKACKATIVLDSPNGELKIERKQTASKSTLEAWVGDHHEHGGVPDVQDWIVGTLGVDYDFFQQMVYFSQEQAKFFSDMGDADRKRILGTLLGTRWYEAAEAEAKLQRGAAQDLLDTATTDLRYEKSLLKENEDSAERVGARMAQWDSSQAKCLTDARLKVGNAEAAVKKAKVTDDSARKRVMDEKSKELAEASVGLQKATERHDAQHKERMREVVNKFKVRSAEASKKLEGLRAKLEAMPTDLDTKTTIETYRHNLEELEGRDKEEIAARAKFEATVEQLTQQANDLRKRIHSIENLESGVACPTCGAAITKESQQACREEAESELSVVVKNMESVTARLNELNEAREITENEITRFKSELSTAQTTLQMGEKLVLNVEAAEKEKSVLAKDRDYELGKVDADHKAEGLEISKDDEALRARIEKRFEKQLSEIDASRAARVATAEAELKQINDTIKRLEGETNPHTDAFAAAEQSCKRHQKEITRLEGEVNVESGRVDVFKFWVRGFGREGIRAALLHDFCRVFTEEVNDTLKQMGVGMSATLNPSKALKSKKNEVRDQLDYIITTATGEMAYQELSGGEKVRIDLASMLTLNLIASRHFGIEDGLFGILVLDEIFSSLDEAGVEIVYQIINGFTARSIFVISHDPSMKSLFDKVIVIVRDGTESVLVT